MGVKNTQVSYTRAQKRNYNRMCNLIRTCILVVAFAFNGEVVAADYLRMAVDLDGDNKPETITITTSGDGDFQKYSLQISNSIFNGEFFAVDGDLPLIETKRTNYNSGRREILLSTIEAASCNYELFSYVQGKLIHLLHTSSHECNAPKPLGNGKVEIHTWERFWDRRDTYSLDSQGLKLTRDANRIYSVRVPGVALNLSVMESAGCKSASIQEGSYVVVSKYDISQRRYLIKNLSDACGWVPENMMPKVIGELPWAE